MLTLTLSIPTGFAASGWLSWRRRESNSCPNIFFKSFLHAYFVLGFRELAGSTSANASVDKNKQPINSLAASSFAASTAFGSSILFYC